MEGRPPPDGDDLFEWTDAPARPSRPEREPESGEREQAAPSPPGRSSPRSSDTAEARRIARGDTGEFERSGRRPPPGRRARRRDLPARVRRRQDFLVGGAVLVVIVLLIVVISGGGGGGETPIPLKRLVGQTIVAKLGSKGPDAALLRRVRKGQVGGLIAFERNAQQLKGDIQNLQAAAQVGDNPPLLVMIDQEGGDVKRLKTGPPDISPADLGKSGDQGQSQDQGEKTGSFLKGLGVNVDLAPVLDVAQPNTADSIKSRTFGSNPDTVASVGVAS